VCCSVLQCFGGMVWCGEVRSGACGADVCVCVCVCVCVYVVIWCSACGVCGADVQFAAVCCSVLQCVVVCCSVL